MPLKTLGTVISASVLALAGCASSPPVGSLTTATVWSVMTPQEWAAKSGLKPAERQALLRAGVDENVVAAGRVVKLHCAMMTDGWWETLGLVPEGVPVTKNTTLRLRMQDAGDNERMGVNIVLGRAPTQLPAGQAAYRFLPNWKEQGLSSNYERVKLPAELQGKYEIVQGSYLVKCQQPE